MISIDTVSICKTEQTDDDYQWYFYDLKGKKLYKISGKRVGEIIDEEEGKGYLILFPKEGRYLSFVLFRSFRRFLNTLPKDTGSLRIYVFIVLLTIFLILSHEYSVSVKTNPKIIAEAEEIDADCKQIKDLFKAGNKARTVTLLVVCFLFYLVYYSISRFFMNGRMDWIYELPLLSLFIYTFSISHFPHNILRLFFILRQKERKEER